MEIYYCTVLLYSHKNRFVSHIKIHSKVFTNGQHLAHGNYEIATDLVDSDARKRAAILLACLGSAAHTIFRTFKIDDDADRNKVVKIKEAFDKHWLGEVNDER